MTANPAKALGIVDRTGTLEAGKMGDVVVWNRDAVLACMRSPTRSSSTARCCTTARIRPPKPRSDFLLGEGKP